MTTINYSTNPGYGDDWIGVGGIGSVAAEDAGDPYAGALLNLQADTGFTPSLWSDQSGNEHDATQADSGKRPASQMIGGYPVVVFDGVDDFMEFTNFADNMASFTLITIARNVSGLSSLITKRAGSYKGLTVDQGGSDVYIQGDDAGNNYVSMTNNPDNTISCFQVRTIEILDLPTKNVHVYINGINTYEQDSSDGTVTDYSNTETVKLNEDLGANDYRCLILFSPALTSERRQAAEAASATRYNVDMTAPDYISAEIGLISDTIIAVQFSTDMDTTDNFTQGVFIEVNAVDYLFVPTRQSNHSIIYYELDANDPLPASGDVITWRYAYNAGGGLIKESDHTRVRDISVKTVMNNI